MIISEGGSTANTQFAERSETYMSSREWLAKHGLKPKKLGFYDVLAGAAFKHRDGVVDVKQAPEEEYQTDAVCWVKLDKFIFFCSEQQIFIVLKAK